VKIDPNRSVAWLRNRIDAETNPRHRAILENYTEHLIAEVTGDLDRIMKTLVPEPVYHQYTPKSPLGEAGHKNRQEVVAMYEGMFKARMNVLERHFDYQVVSDDCLISDGYSDHVFPGALLAARGLDADPEAFYLTSFRICSVLPYVGAGTDVAMAGEDTYTVGSTDTMDSFRKLAPDEIPDLLRTS
jgi:hypothetical protein